MECATKFRSRLFPGIVFFIAAAFALPLTQLLVPFISQKPLHLVDNVIGATIFGLLFTPAAFLWGVLLSCRFEAATRSSQFVSVLTSFLWGVFVSVLTIVSTALFVGVFSSHDLNGFMSKAIGASLVFLVWGGILSLGLVYVLGGVAGIIVGFYFRRKSNN